MQKPAPLDRITQWFWRSLSGWRTGLLMTSALLASLLLWAMLRLPHENTGSQHAIDWLLMAVVWLRGGMANPPTTLVARLGWSATIALFGLTCLTLIAEWLPSWRTPPRRWATYDSGTSSQSIEQLGALLKARCKDNIRLHTMPQGQGQHRVLMLRSARRLPTMLRSALGLGLLTTLVAAGLLATRGWTSTPLDMVVGQRRTVTARDQDYAITLQEIRFEPRPDGPPRMAAQLLVAQPDGADQTTRITEGRAATLPGMRIAWLGQGAAYRVQVHDALGETTRLRQLYADQQGDLLRIPFDDSQQEKWISLVDQGLLLRLQLLSQPDTPQEPYLVAQIREGKSGALLMEQQIQMTTSLDYDGLAIEIAPEAYVEIVCHSAEHLAIAWLACALILLGLVGMLAMLRWPARTVWVVLEPLPDSAGTRWTEMGPAGRAAPAWLGALLASLEREDPSDD